MKTKSECEMNICILHSMILFPTPGKEFTYREIPICISDTGYSFPDVWKTYTQTQYPCVTQQLRYEPARAL